MRSGGKPIALIPTVWFIYKMVLTIKGAKMALTEVCCDWYGDKSNACMVLHNEKASV